jgi:hypothetical protein
MESFRAVSLFLLMGAAVLAQAQATTSAPSAASEPIAQVSADRGPCTADFHVTDLSGKPIYNATIQTTVHWGLAHKIDLQVATNADGRARFVKLPAEAKKPLQFEVTYQDQTVSYGIDPATSCHAERDVPLRVGTAK